MFSTLCCNCAYNNRNIWKLFSKLYLFVLLISIHCSCFDPCSIWEIVQAPFDHHIGNIFIIGSTHSTIYLELPFKWRFGNVFHSYNSCLSIINLGRSTKDNNWIYKCTFDFNFLPIGWVGTWNCSKLYDCIMVTNFSLEFVRWTVSIEDQITNGFLCWIGTCIFFLDEYIHRFIKKVTVSDSCCSSSSILSLNSSKERRRILICILNR